MTVMNELRQRIESRFPRNAYPDPAPRAFQPAAVLAFATRVTDAYAADAKLLDEGFSGSWRVLLDHAHEVYEAVRPCLSIRYSTRTVYAGPEDIVADLERGQLEINTEHCEHPLWTPEENCIFRIAHDVIPHALNLRPFSLEGEVLSYHDHVRRAPAEAKLALFTEIFGYAAIRYSTGVYPEAQKCVVFPELLADYEASFLPSARAAN
ncbi:hypothetical protein [Corallococcus macrosporus]|uniref:Uncharacterized protein n=1 Tax=Myxococcus fulvus (strain ATCC BAA-855 / HW-1) TaxID=483219 RepID=F8CKG7_MYXFH|nr:hypothetical protein [Corallococcus macrosporus]AEI68900.1 hypothetical protein LILAB_35095 [Corallococcus macrosporus]